MAITALFGGLFGLMSWLRVPPLGFAVISIFFLGVGVAQALLFGGKHPRAASVVAGVVLCPLISLSIIAADIWSQGGRFDRDLIGFFECSMLSCLIMGGIFGYLAGCLIASIFLIKERAPHGNGDPLAEVDDLLPANKRPAGSDETRDLPPCRKPLRQARPDRPG